MLKKLITIIIFILIILPFISVQAFDEVDEDVQKGAELYMQAAGAMNKQDFSTAKVKYEEAAQYLSGEIQQDALRMAEFLGKMSSEITAKDLLKGSYFSIVGEVKEDGKVWHFYKSEHAVGILHLAISDEKPLSDLVATIGSDSFTRELVIKNTEGYLSEELTRVPGATSRIRMWYCDKDNTTNIVYENYGSSSGTAASLLEWDKGSVSDVFKKIECVSAGFSMGVVPNWLIVLMVFVVLIAVIIFVVFKKRLIKI